MTRTPPAAPGCSRPCTVTPLRTMTAVAPSGAAAWLTKFWSGPGEVGHGSGNLTAIEHTQFWTARNLILRGGLATWDEARALLIAQGWIIREG